MPVSSTSTFIEVVTRVLGLLNETSVTAFNTPMSVKAQRAVLDALRTTIQGTNWAFYDERIPALSWSNYIATLPDHTKLRRVRWGTDATGYLEIPMCSAEVFYRRSLTPYTNENTYPINFMPYGVNDYAFNPYPADSTTQSKIVFDIIRYPVPPAVADDTLPFPEQYLMLIEYKAASILALSHHQSTELSREWNSHYEMALHNIRSNRGRTVLSMQPSGAR